MTRLALRIMLRHRGRILFFASCIAVGIGFLFAIGNILDTLQGSIAGRARQLMAADATVTSARPFGKQVEELLKKLKTEGYRSSRQLQFVSMLRPPKGRKGAPTLVSIKAVDGKYPFYGFFKTQPAHDAKAFHGHPICYVAKALTVRQGIQVGDRIRLGTLWLKVAGVIANEPDQVISFGGIAPRVIIPLNMAKKTGLIRFGSRIRYQVSLAVPKDDERPAALLAKALKKRLTSAIQAPHIRIRAYTEAQPTVREAMRRSASFFLLASLVALLLGAIGMAASVTAFLNEQIETVGILRSLGLGPKDISSLYLRLCLGIGLLGGIGGLLFGVALSSGGLHLLQQVLGLSLDIQIHPSHLLEGLLLAVVLAVGLNYAAIRALAALSPHAILAGRVHRIGLSRWNIAFTGLLLLVGIALFTFKGSRSFMITGFFTSSLVGSLVACVVLILLALGLLSLISRIFSGGQPWMFLLRHGLRQLIRQRARTLTFLLALSIGVSLLGTLRMLEYSIITEIRTGVGKKVPDIFLVDIQVDQLPKLREMMGKYAKEKPTFSPLVRARLTHINSHQITPKDLKGMTMEARSRARFLSREYNLTYKDALNPSESVIQGAFWKPGEQEVQISLERRFARRMQVGLNDKLTFDIVGKKLTGRVTSIRKINWMSMMPNFFVVLPKKVLEKAPQIVISSAIIGQNDKVDRFQKELVDAFPNISAIALAPIIKRVRRIMRYFVGALRGLAWVCVFVGLLILAGTLNMGRGARRNKVALMRTLGCQRGTLLAVDCVEMLLVGLLTATIATGVALVMTQVFTNFMNIRFHLSTALLVEMAIASVLLPLAVGLLMNRSIYRSGVMENLRTMGS